MGVSSTFIGCEDLSMYSGGGSGGDGGADSGLGCGISSTMDVMQFFTLVFFDHFSRILIGLRICKF